PYPDSDANTNFIIAGKYRSPAAPVTREAASGTRAPIVAPRNPPPANTPAGPGQSYALVIGIGAYDNFKPALNTAVADAESVAALLEADFGYSQDRVKLLRDNQANRSSIMKALYGYKDILGPSDSLLIYYAGHGKTLDKAGAYWLPVDAD